MLNFFSSSYSVYENGVIFIQTLFICKIAKNYNSSIVFLIKNNENLKSLYGFAQNKLDKNSVTSEIVDGKVVFTLKEKGKNGKTIQMTQDQVIASMNRIQELSKELRQESAEKATKIKDFQGARLAQTKSKVGAYGKLLATKEEYLNGKTRPEFQTIEDKQKELLFLQNQLIRNSIT